MIVRLKVDNGTEALVLEWFQFYDSPIKRLKKTISKRFQDTSFNSMIVRLKEKFGHIVETVYIQFQFYDSPIKSVRCTTASYRKKYVSIL